MEASGTLRVAAEHTQARHVQAPLEGREPRENGLQREHGRCIIHGQHDPDRPHVDLGRGGRVPQRAADDALQLGDVLRRQWRDA
jgi:hypothetical protein